jgi:hypothetical protein
LVECDFHDEFLEKEELADIPCAGVAREGLVSMTLCAPLRVPVGLDFSRVAASCATLGGVGLLQNYCSSEQ